MIEIKELNDEELENVTGGGGIELIGIVARAAYTHNILIQPNQINNNVFFEKFYPKSVIRFLRHFLPYIPHLLPQIKVFEVLVKIMAKTFIFGLFYTLLFIAIKTYFVFLSIQKQLS